ncbi:MAG TPA: XRE family transcriptional regulator [Jatrophihabitantaceae bacterium]|jgi:Zn-dependent peptidase ImmA (M78 family)/transcriptional regulator with XRE-family HTH domain
MANDESTARQPITRRTTSVPVSAAEVVTLFSAQRLRLAREARALTQRDLGQHAGVTSAAVSQFEKALSRPTESTMLRLAHALDFPVGFFATGESPSSRPDVDLDALEGTGHFRSLRSVTSAQRREALSVTHLVRDVTDVLDRLVRLPERNVPSFPMGEDDDLSDAEFYATQVREAWDLPAGPVEDVLRVMERNGIVAARHRIDNRTVHAFSAPFPDHPVIVLHQQDAKRDRDRFSASHEAGHLTMHTAGKTLASKAVEDQAHRFAAAFLMPGGDIRAELPARADWPYLLTLKKRWGVSMSALLRRANTLGVMADSTYTHAMRTMSTRGWRTEEPGEFGAPEAPAVLAQASQLAGVSAQFLSNDTGWPADLINSVLTASMDTRPELQL